MNRSKSPSPFRGGGVRGEGPKFLLCLLLLLITAIASAQNRIIRFHGYDGTLFIWSGNLSARAPTLANGWLEPVLDANERRQWKDVLTADGYGGEWLNFLGASKELARGKGDVPLKAQLLFKQVPQGSRFLAIAPGRVSASGETSAEGEAVRSQGIGGVTAALGGPAVLNQVAQRLGLQQFAGPRIWQAMSQTVSDQPIAVLLPSREVIWIESLSPAEFASVPAATGRQVTKAPAAKPEVTKSDPPTQAANFPIAPLLGGVALGAIVVAGIFYRPIVASFKPKEPERPRTNTDAEIEYAKAAKKLQQSLVQVPTTDPLVWLRDKAPQQVAELDKSSKIGHYLLQKLKISLSGEGRQDQQLIDETIESLQKTEAEQHQDWLNLARATGLKDANRQEEIASELTGALNSLKKQLGDQEAFMRKVAAAIDPKTVNQSSPQEALHWSVTQLQKRHQEADTLAQRLQKDSNTVESLKPVTFLGEQIKQALHRVRPAIADREVFAIVGYLLHYSLSTMQTATLNGDAPLRTAMLHNLRTLCAALAPFEDSFAQICEQLKPMIGAGDLQPSTEKHSDQADYLTLLQKALDLRNLRLSPFYIATDAQGRPYSVNTALA